MKSSSTSSPYPRKTPKKTPRKPSKLKPKDPVEVFCRIRPLNDNEEDTCVEVVSNNTIQLTPPQNSQGFKSGHRVTATQHTFKQVFDEDSSQKSLFNTVALDIVHDLIHGKNGLIFAYGITGSGKTHTMTGEPSDGGLLPRGLDVLFNSIGGFQTKPCVFTPDKSNGMDVQGESDAKLDYDRKQKEIAVLQTLGKNRGNDDDITDMVRVPDSFRFDDIDEDNGYAVFVSYVEIYNNFIYDLLEDAKQDLICQKPPVSKQLREDNNRNMYVQGVTEVEVKSTEEAYAMFWKGQKKRRVADTQLNMQSSRSHSVFTLKLVQAPLDPDGESVLLEKEEVCVSTLSMCDLAGSERTNRTKADGDRLREAGNINKDLMTLRSCLEILRENQANSDGALTGKMVPYRDSRLTHLFKNFFDGEGKVRMVVCLNPSAKEYDESVHVMRFAEITQEVVVARPTGISSNAGLAPGRRKANQLFKQALQNINEDAKDGVLSNPLLLKPVATFPPFPLMEMSSSEDCITLVNLLRYLQEREKRRTTLEKDLDRKRATFRQELAKLDGSASEKDKMISELQASNVEKEKEIQKLEKKLKMISQKNDALLKTNQQHTENARDLHTELDEQRKTISKEKQDRMKLKQTLKGVVTQERDKWQKECEKRVKNKELEMETKIIKSEEKLRQLKEIVYKGEKKSVRPSTRSKFFRSRSPPPVAKKPPVKLRHRRSRSTDCWIEHRPAENMETETILRPVLKNKKTVHVPEEKHFKESQATNYVLEHQEADSQGELETKLIKGDVYKTTGGGRCVQFTDVETLKTNFEVARSPDRKRSYPEEAFDEVKNEDVDDDTASSWTDVETRCAVGIEGRPGQIVPSIHHTAKRRKSDE